MSDITVKELEDIARQIADTRARIEQLNLELAAEQELKESQEAEAMDLLTSAGKKSYRAEAGLIGKSERWWVTLPQTPQDKEALFTYLRERGLFSEYATVNANKINSFFMEEWDNEKKNAATSPDPDAAMSAMDFRVPGLSKPEMKPNLYFRKK